MNRLGYITGVLLLLAGFAGMAGCSTTARLAADQTLYTGVKGMSVENASGEGKVPASVSAAVREPLSVKPNNPLISPWLRTPLPMGLWVYNSLYTDKGKGFRAWIYRTLGKQPVVLEREVQPDARVGMVRDILDNHGYFGSAAGYELFARANRKKTKVGYRVQVARPWFFETVEWPAARDTLTRRVGQIAAISNIKPGLQYNVDTLAREQVRITTALRDQGYYWFRPEFVEYLADTTRVPYGVDLRVGVARSAPAAALVPYDVGEVALRLFSADGTGTPDSLEIAGTKVWHQGPLPLRGSVIRRAMSIRTGQRADLPAINRVLDNLTRLGVFRYVNLETPPLDSLRPGDPLDLTLSAAMNTPMEITGEADLAYKSSSFIGPALTLSLKHGNIFKGGEVLSLNFVGSYEWQTGGAAGGGAAEGARAVNSYEIGVNTSLVFPRMLVPGFIGRRLRYGGKTSYTLSMDLLNRPSFFRMLSLGATNTYDFRTSGTVTHSLTPFKMAYNKLLDTTDDFNAAMEANPVIAQSFANQFIPSGAYTFAYDKRFGVYRHDRITVRVTLMSAGNLWSGIYSLAGVRGGQGAQKLFGDPFSQFFKETAELRLFKQLGRSATFAFRAFAGAGHAYGNSRVLPYTEQFYIGGANSIRAFTVRSIGPGSYVSSGEGGYRYFDQTGEMKLEMNAELRFRVAGGLNGAVFFDAGNIWLLRDDPSRPGGRIGQGSGGGSEGGSGGAGGSGGFFNSVATGTGVGVRYDLSFLVVRLDLGIGLHLPYATSRAGWYNIPRFRDGMGLHLAIGYPF